MTDYSTVLPKDVWKLILNLCDFESFKCMSTTNKYFRKIFKESQEQQRRNFIEKYDLQISITNCMNINFEVLSNVLKIINEFYRQSGYFIDNNRIEKCKLLLHFYGCGIRTITDFEKSKITYLGSFTKDVDIIMQQVEFSTRVQAFHSLIKNKFDIVNAIMGLHLY